MNDYLVVDARGREDHHQVYIHARCFLRMMLGHSNQSYPPASRLGRSVAPSENWLSGVRQSELTPMDEREIPVEMRYRAL